MYASSLDFHSVESTAEQQKLNLSYFFLAKRIVFNGMYEV